MQALKNGVASGDFVQNKNSYELSAEFKKKSTKKAAPKKTVAKKKAAPKKKKTTAKKAAPKVRCEHCSYHFYYPL